jgi:hypothetical protein
VAPDNAAPIFPSEGDVFRKGCYDGIRKGTVAAYKPVAKTLGIGIESLVD